MENFEQQFTFEESVESKTGKDFKFEEALTPEAEVDFEKSKKILSEIWPEITNSEKIEEQEISNLNPTEYRALLYEKLKPALDKTINYLGIDIDENSLKEYRDNNDLSEKQIELVKSLEKQFKDTSVGGKLKEIENGKRIDNTWSFSPKEISKNQSVNCSGASLLFGYITEKNGIKTYQARTQNHVFNVLELADGRLMYVDTRVNSEANDLYTNKIRAFVINNYKKEKIGDKTEFLEIEDPSDKHFLPSALLLPQSEAVCSIINNFGALKSEAAQAILPEEKIKSIQEFSTEETYSHSHDTKKIAKQIYTKNQESLKRLNFAAIDKNLCKDIRDLEQKTINEFPINPKTRNIIANDGQEYLNTRRMHFFVRLGNTIRNSLPNVPEGYIRLWRGNRPDEIGKNPQFTKSLEGIALPFLASYRGKLSYIDVPQEDLTRYEQKDGVAPGQEFIVSKELAQKAISVDGFLEQAKKAKQIG